MVGSRQRSGQKQKTTLFQSLKGKLNSKENGKLYRKPSPVWSTETLHQDEDEDDVPLVHVISNLKKRTPSPPAQTDSSAIPSSSRPKSLDEDNAPLAQSKAQEPTNVSNANETNVRARGPVADGKPLWMPATKRDSKMDLESESASEMSSEAFENLPDMPPVTPPTSSIPYRAKYNTKPAIPSKLKHTKSVRKEENKLSAWWKKSVSKLTSWNKMDAWLKRSEPKIEQSRSPSPMKMRLDPGVASDWAKSQSKRHSTEAVGISFISPSLAAVFGDFEELSFNEMARRFGSPEH